jgi:hypothetical protein
MSPSTGTTYLDPQTHPELLTPTPHLTQQGEAATASTGKKTCSFLFTSHFPVDFLFYFINSIDMPPSAGTTYLSPQTQPQTADASAAFARVQSSSDRKQR